MQYEDFERTEAILRVIQVSEELEAIRVVIEALWQEASFLLPQHPARPPEISQHAQTKQHNNSRRGESLPLDGFAGFQIISCPCQPQGF
jgi:hypothetical protein